MCFVVYPGSAQNLSHALWCLEEEWNWFRSSLPRSRCSGSSTNHRPTLSSHKSLMGSILDIRSWKR